MHTENRKLKTENFIDHQQSRREPRCRATVVGVQLLFGCVLMASLAGCNYFVLAGSLIGGPPSIEPDFDTATGDSMTDYGVTVAVLCYAPVELKWEHNKIDQELTKYVTRKMANKKIRVIDSDRVYAWMDKHPHWDTPAEIGEAFNTTYVVHIDLKKYTLYEENSANLYRGRAEAMVTVYKMEDDGQGDRIYSKVILSKFPLQAPKSTSEVKYSTFRRLYLTRLSEEIGRLFFEWYNGDDILDAI